MSPTPLLMGLLALLTSHLVSVVNYALLFSLFVSFSIWMGWLQRLAWLAAELWISIMCLNGAPCTLGSLTLDLWRGHVWATNCLVHTPQREAWKWDAPIIVRVGRVYVEWNVWAFLLDRLHRFWEVPNVDIYTCELTDIQVFVERRHHVFNFYLLDPMVALPDPKDLLETKQEESGLPPADNHSSDNHAHEITRSDTEPIHDTSLQNTQPTSLCPSSAISKPSSASHTHPTSEQETAQQVVDQIMSGLHSTFRGDNDWKALLLQQREQLKHRLRKLQQRDNKVGAVQESMRVIQHVGQAVVEHTKNLSSPEGTLAATMMPQRRTDIVEEPPPNVRVGRVVIREARVFTRDNWANNNTTKNIPPGKNNATATAAPPSSSSSFSTSGWNKPIVLDTVTVRASELCPPLSLMDSGGLPALYQPLDKVMEVVWKRLLAEMAKSQTGRFLNTALGEVLGVMRSGRKSQ